MGLKSRVFLTYLSLCSLLLTEEESLVIVALAVDVTPAVSPVFFL